MVHTTAAMHKCSIGYVLWSLRSWFKKGEAELVDLVTADYDVSLCQRISMILRASRSSGFAWRHFLLKSISYAGWVLASSNWSHIQVHYHIALLSVMTVHHKSCKLAGWFELADGNACLKLCTPSYVVTHTFRSTVRTIFEDLWS